MAETRRTAHWADEGRRRKGEARATRREAAADGRREERAVLAGSGPRPDRGGGLHMLDELAELARTAGARVVGRVYQRRSRPHPGSYLGRGKLLELQELCDTSEATLVVADSDLTPAQVRTMEEVVDLRVIDRSELIIDIFATHARTRQARLQVELAQLRYLAPRLKRMWTHLSRITGAGGIGSRGPGEKQIEVDRRIIQRRIRDLARELLQIGARRSRLVSSRRTVFTVALVGYTNAGKSTLMRRLTGTDVLVADQLFATLDTRTRRWPLESGMEVLLSDTVGFIRKLPHHLVASFHATLEEVREADLLLHVVDASDPEVEAKVQAVREVLQNVGASRVPELVVLNKCDLVSDPVECTILAGRIDNPLRVSATRGWGVDELALRVRERASGRRRLVDLAVPVTDGRTLARLASVGTILSRTCDGETCRITASLPVFQVASFEAYVLRGGEA